MGACGGKDTTVGEEENAAEPVAATMKEVVKPLEAEVQQQPQKPPKEKADLREAPNPNDAKIVTVRFKHARCTVTGGTSIHYSSVLYSFCRSLVRS